MPAVVDVMLATPHYRAVVTSMACRVFRVVCHVVCRVECISRDATKQCHTASVFITHWHLDEAHK